MATMKKLVYKVSGLDNFNLRPGITARKGTNGCLGFVLKNENGLTMTVNFDKNCPPQNAAGQPAENGDVIEEAGTKTIILHPGTPNERRFYVLTAPRETNVGEQRSIDMARIVLVNTDGDGNGDGVGFIDIIEGHPQRLGFINGYSESGAKYVKALILLWPNNVLRLYAAGSPRHYSFALFNWGGNVRVLSWDKYLEEAEARKAIKSTETPPGHETLAADADALPTPVDQAAPKKAAKSKTPRATKSKKVKKNNNKMPAAAITV